jgi:hypothetical protein
MAKGKSTQRKEVKKPKKATIIDPAIIGLACQAAA